MCIRDRFGSVPLSMIDAAWPSRPSIVLLFPFMNHCGVPCLGPQALMLSTKALYWIVELLVVPRQGTPQWFINGNNNTIEGLLGHAASITGTGNTETNNDFTIGTTSVALDAAYNAPQVTSADASLADDAYAIETGSAADLASPKRGASPHQSFVSPYTFTAP